MEPDKQEKNEIGEEKQIEKDKNGQEEETNLLITNKQDYELNVFNILTMINKNKSDKSKKAENEYLLNLLLNSSKLKKTYKLVCLIFLLFLSQNDKDNDNYIQSLLYKIKKIILVLDSCKKLEKILFLKESFFLDNKNLFFYSKDFLNKIKEIITKTSSDQVFLTLVENFLRDIDNNLRNYLNSVKNDFINGNEDKVCDIVDLLYFHKYKNIKPNYLINSIWIFRTKAFLDAFIKAKNEDTLNEVLNFSFNLDGVYKSYFMKEDNESLKNHNGIVFPGPINNYEIIEKNDIWFDPENPEENVIIKGDLVLNKDYFFINEDDWNILKNVFGATNEIKRVNNNDFFYIKTIILEKNLILEENKNLLKTKLLQISCDSNIKDLKNKIIRCLYNAMNKNTNNSVYGEKDVVFYLMNKKNKDILIEICLSFTKKSMMYQSVYVKEIKFSDEKLIKDTFNFIDTKKYILIAEIIQKDESGFIQPIMKEESSEFYNCSTCYEQIDITNKYDCELCNMSLFCNSECADISGEHKTLHEYLNQFYSKKYEINTEKEIQNDKLNGYVGLDKEKNSSCINSVIQCLSNTDDLTTYFINDFYKNDMNIIDYLIGNGKDLLINYYDLIKQMWLGDKKSKACDALHKEFTKIFKNVIIFLTKNDNFSNPDEILTHLLNILHKKLIVNIDNINKKKNKEEVKEKSIITDLFQGVYELSFTCSNCRNVSMIYNDFKYLILPIPKKNNILSIKYFNEFECKYMKFILDENSTIKHLKDKAIGNISDKVNHLVSIMSLTELIDVTAFDTDDEKLLSYTTMYNSIELVQFDKYKVLTKVYMTNIPPEKTENDNKKDDKKKGKDSNNNNNHEEINTRNELNLILHKIYKDNSDAELVFYEKSVIDKNCINIYIYPFLYNEKEDMSKNKDRLFNSYPIALSTKLDLILENFEYLVNVKLRDLLIDHFKEESETTEKNYIELVVPHYFGNSSYYSQANCPICKDKRKYNYFCPLFSSIDKEKTIKDLLTLFDYPNNPIFLLAKCKFYDEKKTIYSNMNPFSIERVSKKLEDNKIDIYDCFEAYTKKLPITNLKWSCKSCKSEQIPYQQVFLHRPPLYLIIQLDRSIKKTAFGKSCDETFISYPINDLDISEYIDSSENFITTYNLYGVIYRELSFMSDYTYATCQNNKKWVMYKDKNISRGEKIVNKNAHFLFYKRNDLQV